MIAPTVTRRTPISPAYDVQRRVDIGGKAGDDVTVRWARHKNAVGAGRAKRLGAAQLDVVHRLASTCPIVPICVGPRVEHKRNIGGVRRRPSRRDSLDREFEIKQRFWLAVIGILDIDTDGAGGDGLRHRIGDLIGRDAIARFHIGGQRHVHLYGDAVCHTFDIAQHLIQRHDFAHRIAAGIADPAARVGDGLEPGAGQPQRAGDVPGIGQHDDRIIPVRRRGLRQERRTQRLLFRCVHEFGFCGIRRRLLGWADGDAGGGHMGLGLGD